ncbi:MAG: metalloregulator ArsR/SmtB family transcription factor [Lachnospiraceae bacterium]|nr:metalloregulator ArsR/SmtB family transcription factor [Lachnospiraceae bacterium]
MENTMEDIQRLKAEFQSCQKILTAIGDETRQHLLYILLQCECRGSRVIDISKKTNLSRPAVSHHMQILKDAGMVKIRKESTCIYYYLDPSASEVRNMITLFCDIEEFMKNVPDRKGSDD